MKLFIACMSSPVQVIKALQNECGMERTDVCIHPINARFADNAELKAEAKAAKVILVQQYSDFIAQLSLFNAYPRTVILLAPVLHAERLSDDVSEVFNCTNGIEYLDTVPATISTSTVHRFHPLDTKLLKHHDFSATYTAGFVAVNDEEYLPKLIDSVRSGSLLNNLMSAVYRIGKATTQKMVKSAFIRWMVEDGSDWELLSLMLTDCGLSDSSIKKISDIIRKDGALHLTIIAQLRKTRADKEEDGTLKVDSAALARKYPDFDAYELRYILKVYSGLTYDVKIAGKSLKEIYYARERNTSKAAHAVKPVAA